MGSEGAMHLWGACGHQGPYGEMTFSMDLIANDLVWRRGDRENNTSAWLSIYEMRRVIISWPYATRAKYKVINVRDYYLCEINELELPDLDTEIITGDVKVSFEIERQEIEAREVRKAHLLARNAVVFDAFARDGKYAQEPLYTMGAGSKITISTIVHREQAESPANITMYCF